MSSKVQVRFDMVVHNIVKRNFHRDSVQLLHLSEEARKLPEVQDAAVVMGTGTNKELLDKLGLLTSESRLASESDMIIAVQGERVESLAQAVAKIEEMLMRPSPSRVQRFYGLDPALHALSGANLAIVSIPGEFASTVVRQLFDQGLHVHLFSDHVPLEQEVELKRLAADRGLLLLGPGAGTSIINGKAIAFANVVDRGRIGIVAAAGTGLQEVSVLLSRAGIGVSQGLGVGGGDVKKRVGGLMTIESVKALEADPSTEILLLVSKPPDREVQEKIVEYIASQTRKRYITCFLGSARYRAPAGAAHRLKQTQSLHAAALEAARMTGPDVYQRAIATLTPPLSALIQLAGEQAAKLTSEQQYLRGYYTGGTLAYEALVLLKAAGLDVYSNAPLDKRLKLPDSYTSFKHTVVDLGEEEFTAGRAHPMIDPTLRRLRLVEEAKDSEVAVMMLDMMLGYGSHPDPAGAMLDAIKEARQISEAQGRHIAILAHVCGTELDPQDSMHQERMLKEAGVQLFTSNAVMVIVAAMIVSKGSLADVAVGRLYRDYLFPQGDEQG